MARKSRKIAAAEPVCEAAPLQIFPTAIYARLSVENSGKSEKVDVITNQIGDMQVLYCRVFLP